jgi:hypothetical protein
MTVGLAPGETVQIDHLSPNKIRLPGPDFANYMVESTGPAHIINLFGRPFILPSDATEDRMPKPA